MKKLKGMIEMDKQIEFLINVIISELKKDYPDLNSLLYYNSSFDDYELAIERSNYGSDEQFKKCLYDTLEEKIYSQGLYVYVYFTEDFSTVKEEFEVDKTLFRHEEKIDCGTRLSRIENEIHLIYKEKPDAKLSYQVLLSPYRAVLVETKSLSTEVENEIENGGELKSEPNKCKLKIVNK